MAEDENADLGPGVVAIEDEATGTSEAERSWLTTLSREFGRTFRRGKDGIDLLVDASESALVTTTDITKKLIAIPKRDRSLTSDEEALFQRLGEKCADCRNGDYLTLKNDVEFWELAKRLHSIRGKASKEVVAEEEPEEEVEESSSEDSPVPEVLEDDVVEDRQTAVDSTTVEEPNTYERPKKKKTKGSFNRGKGVKKAAAKEKPREEEAGESSLEDSQIPEVPAEEQTTPKSTTAEEPEIDSTDTGEDPGE